MGWAKSNYWVPRVELNYPDLSGFHKNPEDLHSGYHPVDNAYGGA
jgi:hypothetical protein